MALPQTFTVAELEKLSGLDRRTIAYYISEGLLPKVGRRGPKTRYPREFLDRLQLIKRIRDLMDAGQLPSATLAEISAVLKVLAPQDIHHLASPSAPDSRIAALFEEGAGRAGDTAQLAALQLSDAPKAHRGSPASASARRRRMVAAGSAPETERRASPQLAEEVWAEQDWSASARDEAPLAALGESAEREPLRGLLHELEQRAARGRETMSDSSAETLTRIPITDNVMLSVRGLGSEEDREFAEHVAKLLANYFA